MSNTNEARGWFNSNQKNYLSTHGNRPIGFLKKPIQILLKATAMIGIVLIRKRVGLKTFDYISIPIGYYIFNFIRIIGVLEIEIPESLEFLTTGLNGFFTPVVWVGAYLVYFWNAMVAGLYLSIDLKTAITSNFLYGCTIIYVLYKAIYNFWSQVSLPPNNKPPYEYRGDSLLLKVIVKSNKYDTTQIIQLIVEPILLLSAGTLIKYINQDIGLILILSGLALFIEEMKVFLLKSKIG